MIFNSNCELILPNMEFENICGYDRLTNESKTSFFDAFKKRNFIK